MEIANLRIGQIARRSRKGCRLCSVSKCVETPQGLVRFRIVLRHSGIEEIWNRRASSDLPEALW